MATMKDIAHIAGKSVATVSLALSGSPLVKLETRYRIQEIARELDYHPNQYARSLVTKETKVIALFRTYDISYPVDSEDTFSSNLDTLVLTMLPAVQSSIQQYGYSVLVDTFTPDPAESQKNPIFNSSTIDGALFFGGMVKKARLDDIKKSSIPSVLICARNEYIDYVDTDPCEGIRLATEYMAGYGHKQIALVNGSEESQSSALKLSGYKLGLENSGIIFDPGLAEYTNFSGYSAWEAMERLDARGFSPTAYVCATDLLACAVMQYLYRKGLYCPRDVSIIGYENTTPAMYSAPPLTSVSIQKNRLGSESANILLNRIRNPKARHVELVIPPRLVERESVCAPS